MSQAIEELVKLMSRLPGIGERTAARLTLQVLAEDQTYAAALGESLLHLHQRAKRCSACGNFGDEALCAICNDPRRNTKQICVVARVPDLMAIERARSFKGVYHVLHKLFSPLEGVGPQDLDIESLRYRVRQQDRKSVV